MRNKGFTLVEILIVVIIIGIIAALIVPQFSNAALESRETMLMENLRSMRTQINIYKAQHNDITPGYDGENLSAEIFINQLTKFTDQNGNISDTKSDIYNFGPYLSEMPSNPLNQSNGVLVIANAQAMPISAVGGNEFGWIYKADEGDFRANSIGNDRNGRSYYGY